MDMAAKFGPAGTCNLFKEMGYKQSLEIPAFLTKVGLDHFEYQCGRGVNIGEEKAVQLGAKFKEAGKTVSLHAPYYISMSSVEEEKRRNSVNYILSSAEAVDFLGGDRIVVHTGSCSKMSREEALGKAIETLGWSLDALKERGLSHIHICPETMGKINQLGTLDEVIALCKVDESVIPCIDFGHLNARTQGEVNSLNAFENILSRIENELGAERLKNFHSHFSKIEYTEGGEKRHLTFEDAVYGPNFEPLMELVYKKGLSPIFVCESAGTQSLDALSMKKYYDGLE